MATKIYHFAKDTAGRFKKIEVNRAVDWNVLYEWRAQRRQLVLDEARAARDEGWTPYRAFALYYGLAAVDKAVAKAST